MNIKVVGTGCPKCSELYENSCKATDNCKIDANIEKVEALLDIIKLGVRETPALMINDNIVVSGQVASVSEIEKLLEEYK